MNTFGILEAKARFSQLLARVAKGEQITITKHGEPVAILIPPLQKEQPAIERVISDFIDFYSKGKKRSRGKLSVRSMIDEGRRY